MRWSAQRYGSWEWLDYEVPLITSDGAEWVLSSYGVMRATIPSPAARVFDAVDGRPIFESWGTLLHLEIDEGSTTRRMWSGVVKDAVLDASGWTLQIVEFPGYFSGLPYEGLVRGIKADPAALLRQIVGDSQQWRNSWFGCTVEGSTKVRLGTDLDLKVASARATMDARKKTYDQLNKTKADKTAELTDAGSTLADEVASAKSLVASAQVALATLIQNNAPSGEIAAARATLTSRQTTYNQALSQHNSEIAAGKAALRSAKTNKEAAKTAYDSARDAYQKAKDERADKGGAYEIRGEDLKDTFRVITDLCRASGVEWTTRTVYSETEPDLRIVVHHPTAGGYRSNLVFDTSTNITHELSLESYGDFANAGVGVGAGEGPKAIRRTLNLVSPRMRRPVVVEDKSLKTNAQMDATLRREVALMLAPPYPRRIEVRDHPNCRIGSWGVGDIIRVSGTTTRGQVYSELLRVVSWKWKSQYKAEIELQPAEPV